MSTPHPFEQSGNGPAPYTFKGVTVDAPKDRCDHCNTHIKYNFNFIAADGNVFVVGSDCVLKAKGTAEYLIAKRWKREHTKALARARKQAKKEQGKAQAFAAYPDLPELLAVDHYITRDISRRFETYGSVSPKQVDLLRKLAGESKAKREKKAEVQKVSTKVPAIVEFFQTATSPDTGKALKFPKLTWVLEHEDTGKKQAIQIKRAGDGSRRPGDFYVTDGGSYGNSTFYGWIDAATGAFEDRKSPEWVTEFLVAFNADPVKVAFEYGKGSGQCCFCSKELTQEGSKHHGYGPVCAKNWGLPWKATVKA